MVAPAPKFGVRFLSRKERTVRRVTKYETKEIQKRSSHPIEFKDQTVFFF